MNEKRLHNLKLVYGIALSFIALTLLSSSFVMQYAIKSNGGDSRVINLSGRQRMLSQRLTKCVLAIDRLASDSETSKRRIEIIKAFANWKEAHLGLQHGDDKLGLPQRENSPEIRALFSEIEPFHAAMVKELDVLVKSLESGKPDHVVLHSTADVMLANEPGFLGLMDKITFQFDKEAHQRLTSMQHLEKMILLVGLLVLTFEFFFVFRPSITQLTKMMASLREKGEQLKESNELLQNSLDRSLQLTEQANSAHLAKSEYLAEVQRAYEDLKKVQGQLLQQDKMASVGHLAAGVAHEINNPMGFIISNLGSLGKYVEKMSAYLAADEKIMEGCAPEIRQMAAQERQKYKIDHICRDMPDLITESSDGAHRVRQIVQDLKNFSRIDDAQFAAADINEGLESTISIAWNELKYKTTIIKEYGQLPLVWCNLGQLNQVFLNILVNAAHAIKEQGEIRIATREVEEAVQIAISDTGDGISPENIKRIFDPFFTTKEVGKGTGLGLAIAYDIVVNKHAGSFEVKSEIGSGTTFTVTLPVKKETSTLDTDTAEEDSQREKLHE